MHSSLLFSKLQQHISAKLFFIGESFYEANIYHPGIVFSAAFVLSGSNGGICKNRRDHQPGHEDFSQRAKLLEHPRIKVLYGLVELSIWL